DHSEYWTRRTQQMNYARYLAWKQADDNLLTRRELLIQWAFETQHYRLEKINLGAPCEPVFADFLREKACNIIIQLRDHGLDWERTEETGASGENYPGGFMKYLKDSLKWERPLEQESKAYEAAQDILRRMLSGHFAQIEADKGRRVELALKEIERIMFCYEQKYWEVLNDPHTYTDPALQAWQDRIAAASQDCFEAARGADGLDERYDFLTSNHDGLTVH